MKAGTILRNRYRILKRLGSGSFGDTYLAEDGDLPGNPRCVVKHLKPQQSNVIDKAKELFEREAETLYKLGKKNEGIPELFAYFEEGGQFYLVQEYIEGQDLSQEIIPGRQLSESYVRALLVGILEVLEVAHGQNVIHRDIKPPNLMRRKKDGKIVLIDFGAVKETGTLIANSRGQTIVSVVVGTPGYMPGEQAKGRPRLSSDIYAVGMVGIQALTGVLPQELSEDPQTGEVVWRNRVSVSKELGDVLEKMARDHFSKRYKNATEALAALVSGKATQQKLPVVPSPPPPPPPPPKVISSPPPPKGTTTQTFTTVKVNNRGQIIEKSQGQAEVLIENLGRGIIFFGRGVTLEMVYIPGGRFLMGSPENEKRRSDSESPQHDVRVPPFFLGKYPVTQAQYRAVMGENPSKFKGANRPVETVTWNHATEFCQKLSQRTGKTYRLPSEAQWEYACRAGTTTPFYFGKTITTDLANYRGTSIYGSGPKGVYREQTTDVGSFPPNAFGLYDMHGNVWEWCLDVWHENYNDAPTDGSDWVFGEDSRFRMLRGGSWYGNPWDCRCADRCRNDAGYEYFFIGFRVVLLPGA